MTVDANQHQLPLIERVERALLLVAVLIEFDGDVHVPLYERLETEFEALRRKAGTKARARLLLASYHRAHDVPGELSDSSSASSWATLITHLYKTRGRAG